MAKFTRGRLLAGAAPLVAAPMLGKLALDEARAGPRPRALQSHLHDHRAEGHAAYRAALQRFVDEVRPVSHGVMLKNEIRWFSEMITIVGKAALAGFAPVVPAPARPLAQRM